MPFSKRCLGESQFRVSNMSKNGNSERNGDRGLSRRFHVSPRRSLIDKKEEEYKSGSMAMEIDRFGNASDKRHPVLAETSMLDREKDQSEYSYSKMGGLELTRPKLRHERDNNNQISSISHDQVNVQFGDPPVPSIDELSTGGYLNHVRPASMWQRAGGYSEKLACYRALTEAHCGLF